MAAPCNYTVNRCAMYDICSDTKPVTHDHVVAGLSSEQTGSDIWTVSDAEQTAGIDEDNASLDKHSEMTNRRRLTVQYNIQPYTVYVILI